MNATFTCPRCGRTSHNPNDVREGYCGACHDWTRPKTAAHDLPPEKFPVTVRAFLISTGRLVWEEVVTEAPVVVRVPPLAKEHGGPVRVTVDYGDGTHEEAVPEAW